MTPLSLLTPASATIPARLENREVLEHRIESRFATLTQSTLIGMLDQAGIANGAVNDVPAVANHPQLGARSRWSTTETPNGPVPALRAPHNLAMATPMGRVPGLGEHTSEILAEL